MIRQFRSITLAFGALGLSVPALAAPGEWVKAVTESSAPRQRGAIDLPVSHPRANAAPEGWAQQKPGQRIVYNVGSPQLLPYPSTLPARTMAPAVLLVPGGGYQFLAMDNEGYDVASRLDRLGVRVFIVKYRTVPLTGGFPGFIQAITRTFVNGVPPDLDNRPLAIADTQAAIRLVRSRAAEWHVDPHRIGIVGFSAGAITVLGALQANASDSAADFAGLIYGPTTGTAADVPTQAPPLFAAIAADDRFFKSQDLGLIHAWRQSGSQVELHLYSGGGHGFASQPNGTTSDAWFDQFALWLKDNGLIGRR